jgi:epoxide hydrolase-like predicted phosphatase
MPVKAVVFDIGGVLEVNPRTGWQHRWGVRLQLEPGECERRVNEIWRPGSLGHVSLEEIERRTADALALDAAALAELMDDAWSEYVGTLNAELAEYFTCLRPRFRTGILSNSFVGARARERAAYSFEEMCDTIVYSHEVGCMKPDPKIYQIVCERLEVRPQDALLLDDVEENVEGARAIGMKAIAFTSTAQAIADLEAQTTSDRRSIIGGRDG